MPASVSASFCRALDLPARARLLQLGFDPIRGLLGLLSGRRHSSRRRGRDRPVVDAAAVHGAPERRWHRRKALVYLHREGAVFGTVWASSSKQVRHRSTMRRPSGLPSRLRW